MSNQTQFINGSSNDYLAGGIFLSTSIVVFILYAPVIYVFSTSKTFYKNPCYALILSLSVSDCLSSISFLFFSFHLFTKFMPPLFNSILSALIMSQWRNMGEHQMLIAINRYITICYPLKVEAWYSRRCVISLMVFAWVFSFLMSGAPLLIPPMAEFGKEGYFINYYRQDIVQFGTIDDYVETPLVLISTTLSYALVLKRYHKTRRSVQSHITHIGTGTKESLKHAFRIAWQTLSVSIVYVLLVVSYYIFDSDDTWSPFVLTWTLLANNGMAPLIYLIFNKDLRIELKKRFNSCCG